MHKIKMVDKETGIEVTYDNVKSVDYMYGCEVILNLENGETATFERDNWEMWDLTPYKGWNDNIN